MSDWKPGDVAVAIRHDGTESRAIRRWDDTWRIQDECVNNPPRAFRPLVVIDPEDREQVALILSHYHDWKWTDEMTSASISDMQAALREFANPKPPKPDEPTGLGAVVEDAAGARWVRVGVTIGNLHWRSTEPGNTNCFKWQAIDAVRVLSEGVQP